MDYADPKAYRMISMSSFLLKSMEKAIDQYLVKEWKLYRRISRRQHAYVSGRSTDTALHNIVGRIEKTLEEKEMALGVFFDIEGAFDKIGHEKVKENLEEHGIDPMVVRWIVNLLRMRKAIIEFRGVRREVRVSRGCPQGGCLSPHLWILIVESLIRKLTRQGVYVQVYSDDGVILVRGKHADTVSGVMQGALRLVEEWCMEQGLTVNPEKTGMVLFTRKRNVEVKRPMIFGKRLELRDSVKYLGVTLDKKLTWKEHVEKIYEKAMKAIWTGKRMVGRLWGLKPSRVYWIHQMIVKPRITYGAVVWWEALRKDSNVKKLTRVQRIACIMILGAMDTTPTAAMEMMLSMVNVKWLIYGRALATFLSLEAKGQWVPTFRGGHGEVRRLATPLGDYMHWRKDEITSESILGRKYSTDCAYEGEAALDEEGVVNCYTDGSRLEELERTGAGVWIPRMEKEESLALGKYATVFQAEVLAILSCATIRELIEAREEKINIWTDSQAAIKALAARTVSSKFVKECMKELNKLGERKEVRLKGKRHTGMPGNEKADELAKKGSASVFVGPEPVLPITKQKLRGLIREWEKEEMNKEWRRIRGCKQAKRFIIKMEKKMTEFLLQLGRKELRLMVEVITGHGGFAKHMVRLKVKDDSTCEDCLEEEGTAAHFLGKCPRYCRLRYEIFGYDEINEVDFKNLKLKDIEAYIRRTKR